MVLAAVTLDAAGTLFEPAEPVASTYARVAARHGIALEPAALECRLSSAFSTAPPLAFPGVGPARLADHERAWWQALVRRAFGPGADGGAFDVCFAELFAHYARAAAWRVFPEVPDTLAALRARGLRLAVVSNFDGRLPGVLAGLGLTPMLDLTVYSTHAGAAKPDPAIFQHALATLAVAPAAALHAGDGVVPDVDGARSTGMRAVLVDREGRRPTLPPGVPTIATLAELPRLQQ